MAKEWNQLGNFIHLLNIQIYSTYIIIMYINLQEVMMRRRPPPPTKDGNTGDRLDTNTFVSQNGTLNGKSPYNTLRTPTKAQHSPHVSTLHNLIQTGNKNSLFYTRTDFLLSQSTSKKEWEFISHQPGLPFVVDLVSFSILYPAWPEPVIWKGVFKPTAEAVCIMGSLQNNKARMVCASKWTNNKVCNKVSWIIYNLGWDCGNVWAVFLFECLLFSHLLFSQWVFVIKLYYVHYISLQQQHWQPAWIQN